MPDIPNKRKQTVNPKLLDSDNMSIDAIKRRKVEAMKTVTQPQTQPKPSTSQRVTVEEVEDNDDIGCSNAGTPTNPNTILESANDDDDDGIYVTPGQATERAKTKEAETEEEPEETETNEDELGMAIFDHHRRKTYSTHF